MGLAGNFHSIEQRIVAACERSGRSRDSVLLLAVSKGMPPASVEQAIEIGQTYFGESKVQEARAKIPLCHGQARWHMIGHLQSNKCREAVQLFEMVQSVDTVSLAEELNKSADKAGKDMPVLLEVNVAGEGTKFGFKPDALLESLLVINALPRLVLQGLMTIAPWSSDPEKARPAFRRLRELKSEAEQRLGAPLPHLSMGMTGDFEPAIEEGATIIRVGTALFGSRPKLTPPPGDGP